MEDDSPDVPLAYATFQQMVDEFGARADTLVVLVRTKAEPEKVMYYHRGNGMDALFMMNDSARDLILKMDAEAEAEDED